MLPLDWVMTSAVTTTPSEGAAGPRDRYPRGRAAALAYVLGSLLAFAALNAFAGGCYGLAGARGIPTEWLRGSPFSDYFIPSLILVAIVGSACLAGAIAVFARWRHDRWWAIAAGVILLAWLAVELAIIGYVSWMQPATVAGGAIIVALAWLLPREGAADRAQRKSS
jgi:hypothetical protein